LLLNLSKDLIGDYCLSGEGAPRFMLMNT